MPGYAYLDYRDVNPNSVTVADLMDFDALIARLSERDREIFHKKLAHEVAESEPARSLATANDTVDELEADLAAQRRRADDAQAERDEALTRLESLRADFENAERDAAEANENLVALRQEHAALLRQRDADIAAGYERGYKVGYEHGREQGRAEAAA